MQKKHAHARSQLKQKAREAEYEQEKVAAEYARTHCKRGRLPTKILAPGQATSATRPIFAAAEQPATCAQKGEVAAHEPVRTPLRWLNCSSNINMPWLSGTLACFQIEGGFKGFFVDNGVPVLPLWASLQDEAIARAEEETLAAARAATPPADPKTKGNSKDANVTQVPAPVPGKMFLPFNMKGLQPTCGSPQCRGLPFQRNNRSLGVQMLPCQTSLASRCIKTATLVCKSWQNKFVKWLVQHATIRG